MLKTYICDMGRFDIKKLRTLFFLCTYQLLIGLPMSFSQTVEEVNQQLNTAEAMIRQNTDDSYDLLMKLGEDMDAWPDSTKAFYHSCLGRVYLQKEKFGPALESFYKEYEIFEGNIDSLTLFRPLNELAGLFLLTEQYDKSAHYFDRARKMFEKQFELMPEKMAKRGAILYNNMGVLHRKIGATEKALLFYKKSHEFSMLLPDVNISVVHSLQNIANAYADLGQYDKAVEYLLQANEANKSVNNECEQAGIENNMGNIYLEMNKKDSAQKYLRLAFERSETGNYPTIMHASGTSLIQLYAQEDNYKQAFYLQKVCQLISDSLHNKASMRKLAKAELEFAFQRKEAAIREKQREKEWYYTLSLVVLLMITSVLFLLFRLKKKENHTMNLEKLRLKEQLDYKNKELTGKVMHLLQITEIINQVTKRLMGIRKKTSAENEKEIYAVIRELQNQNNVKYWEEFELRFKETHEDFYNRLLKRFPDLSKNEIRLCAFLKMNLSTKEIAAITQQTTNSISVARTRLRKKLGLSNSKQSLSVFFTQI